MTTVITDRELINLMTSEHILCVRAWVENLGYVEVDKNHFIRVITLYPYEVRFVCSTSASGSMIHVKACENSQLLIK
jgi:hypothetical protein